VATIDHPPEALRIDVWLDVACLFKTRSEAKKACLGGKIAIRRQIVKPNRLLRVGDEIEISRPHGRKQRIVVRALEHRHVARDRARELYEDLTPPPTAEELALFRMERLHRAATAAMRAPDKRQRRELRRLKGRWGE
jgi:ribosome-associated heat shock protein Hsp15